MEEKLYRKIVDEVFHRIDVAFENVDPDLAESIFSQGTLNIVFRNQRQLILSPQAPLRQIWVAFHDRAWHFSLDEKAGRWLDDREHRLELLDLVQTLTQENAGVAVAISAT